MPSPSFLPVTPNRGAEFTPSDHGFEAWTHDPYYPASSTAGTSGTVYVVRLPVRRAYTSAALWWGVVGSGTVPVAGQNWTGIYSSAGQLLGQAAADGQITSAGGKRSPITAAVSGQFVWAAFLFNATTVPTMLRGSSFESTPSMNLPTAGLRAAVAATGATVLPASFDPATLTTSNCITFFAAMEAA